MASLLPLLHRAAPRLTKKFFQPSRRCSNHLYFRNVAPPRLRTLPPRARNLSSGSRRISATAAEIFQPKTPHDPPAQSVKQASNPARTKSKTRLFPVTSSKVVAYWLLGSAVSVFGLVVFGGLTRLTESGLSITEWKPVTGSWPPTNEHDWESEFAKYRSSPEFTMLNPNMTLSEFKSIYYMEWTHRVWGRVVGLSFVLPALYFIARGKVSKSMALKIGGIGGLIGFQGAIGWWMVKSGLKDDLFAPGSHPRVSQYRLVAHLGTAFLCYSAMLWNGLSILREHKLLGNLQAADSILARLENPRLRMFQRSIGALGILVFITAMSGGLVAGLDAGLIYNEFPKMGSGWIPPKSELISDFYSHNSDHSDMWWRNPLENPSLVQLDHRILATTAFTAIMALFAYSRFSPKVKTLLPRASRKGMHGVVGFACLQVTLGISTLIYLVPLPLASAHQAGSLALLSWILILANRTWLPNKSLSRLLARRFAAAKITPAATALRNPAFHSKAVPLKATAQLKK